MTTQMVTSTQLVGVCLYIFCHPSHVAFVRDVAVADVKTGAGGKVGNKGAVGVHLRFYNTRWAGFDSHAAHVVFTDYGQNKSAFIQDSVLIC